VPLREVSPLPPAGRRRLGAIDIGTNTIKLLVAEVDPEGGMEVLLREKSLVRLGSESLTRGELPEEATVATADTIRGFLRSIRGCGAELGRAVATCAVREASNSAAFLEEIRQRTSVSVDVISGDEEARLVNLAVRSEFPSRLDPLLLIDIGGGSTELVISDGPRVRYTESLPLGVVRLAARYARNDPPSREDRAAMKKEIRAVARKACDEIRKVGFRTCVGSSGTIQSLSLVHEASILGREPTPTGHRALTREGLKRVGRLLARTTEREKLRIDGLDPKRRDIAVPGAILLAWLLKRTGADSIEVGERGLREGVLLDLVTRAPGRRAARVDRDVRSRSVERLLHRYDHDPRHAEHVSKLAVGLFDATERLHQLTATEREWLQYGALLHDIGSSVAYPKHQRHSYYLITHGDLTGFSAEEVEILASLGRYHRKRPPSRQDENWKRLDPYVRPSVEKLIALMRVADGLDRTHRQLVTSVAARVGLKRVEIQATAVDDCEAEIAGARRKADLFEKVFDRRVEFRAVPAAPAQPRAGRKIPLESLLPHTTPTAARAERRRTRRSSSRSRPPHGGLRLTAS
jgi:exopolyphosphatase/guanosine-5'-triphosphate,3'-diphosphate pyrophosphatase